MSVKDAAHKVLKEAGHPLSGMELAHRIQRKGSWRTSGKTPQNTITAALYTDIKELGRKSRFVNPEKGKFSLREFFDEKVEQPAGARRKNLTFTDSAEKALAEFGHDGPMHYRDITKKALEKGWLTSTGLTPEFTMAAQLGIENRRREKRGDQPRFVLHGRKYAKGPGYVSLRQESGIDDLIKQNNDKVKKELTKHIRDMDPGKFEALAERLLSSMGFIEVKRTTRGNDGGIDVKGTLAVGDDIKIKMAVQAKRWKGNVQSPVIQNVRGSLGAHEQGLIIAAGGFSNGAKKEAERADATPISLIDGDRLAGLLMEHDIGVARSTPNLFELDKDSLDADE